MSKAKYSIVVPVFNEEESIPMFYDKITPIMESTNEPYEIIMVNDGSRDKTPEMLEELAKKDNRIKVINFSRNFGQQNALLAGFTESQGDAVVDIDVDLQDPPEVILQMIEKWKEGFDIVHGKRKSRAGESIFKKLTAFVYARFVRKITNMSIPKDTGDFKLFDRKVIDTLIAMPEHNRFLRGLSTWVGYKQTFVEFDRKERVAGTTKYSVKKLVKLASDGIVANSNYPLGLSMKCGILLGVLSVATFITFIVLACVKIVLPLVAWLFPSIALMFALCFVFNGLTNMYIGRMYEEVKGRPRYIVRDKINF